MKQVLIQASNVSQNFQVGHDTLPAIRNANLNIVENTFNIIYGPSGSGKSTLLNVLSGLQKPSAGQVLVKGENIYEYSSDELAYYRANHVGVVYQTNYWVKSLNVIENISLPLYFLGYNRSSASKMAKLALERIGLGVYAKKYPYYLSGGEQQRLSLARALSTNPLFILADEPTGNLDSKNGDRVMDLLQNCKDEYRSTIILVTHNLEYLPLADTLMEIEDGTVTQINENTEQVTESILQDLKNRLTEMRHRAGSNA